VYLEPDQAWGLDVWAGPPSPSLVAGSLAVYDGFYRHLESVLDRAAANGRLVVLDLHSYNHLRDGPDSVPADPDGNPDVNLGTGTVDRGLEGRDRPLRHRSDVRLARWQHLR
jgi:N-formylglutamate deformylase